jgi:hypothetical protein
MMIGGTLHAIDAKTCRQKTNFIRSPPAVLLQAAELDEYQWFKSNRHHRYADLIVVRFFPTGAE